jgi:GNAT superfamily N-acetyltransferase
VDNLLVVGDLIVRPIENDELASTLEVYKESEDFLALGPVATASMSMIVADIERSANDRGVYCGIWKGARQVGVLDFIPEASPNRAVLSLLLIAKPYRHQGIGTSILEALVAHLRTRHGIRVLEGGVQINNPSGIRFWQRHGFEIGSDAQDFEDGTTAYPMCRRIPSAKRGPGRPA